MTSSPPAHIYLGGSFDPVHKAHVFMAERIHARLCERHAPHHIHFLPTAGSPLKNTQTTSADRVAMLELALADAPFSNLSIDRREINQTPPVYTIDTLTSLRAELGEQVPIIFVMGLDSLQDLPKWRRGHELLDFCHFWVFDRHTQAQSEQHGANHWSESMTKYDQNQPKKLPDDLKSRRAEHVDMLLSCSNGYIFFDSACPPSISSTQVRSLAACHINDAKHLLHSGVWAYIKSKGLYKPET